MSQSDQVVESERRPTLEDFVYRRKNIKTVATGPVYPKPVSVTERLKKAREAREKKIEKLEEAPV